MITATDLRVFTVTCCYCKQGEQGHRRDNGTCMAYERAETKPYVLRTRRVVRDGWVVRR